jgi:hypothetical protein
MKKRNFILALLLVFPLLTGCIKDDFKDCLYITFDAINPKHVYTEQVERVDLYFYDPESDALVREYHFERDQLRKRDRAAIIPDAPAGTFRVLAIVNDGIYTVSENIENYVRAYTEVTSDELSYDAESLFSAAKEITVLADPDYVQVENMQLTKHNNNVIIHIEYDEEAPYIPTDGTNLTAWIDGSNRRQYYLNEGQMKDKYELYTTNGSSKLTSNYWERIDNTAAHRLPDHPARFSFTTMRLWHGSDVSLHVQETPQSGSRAPVDDLRTVDIDLELRLLLDESQQIYGSDLDLEYHDEFHITVRLDNGGVVVGDPTDDHLIVKKWDYVHGDIPL